MILRALIDGEEAASIGLEERGLHYGDGLFETMRVRDGDLPLWPLHAERLCEGCERLHLPPPDLERVEGWLARLAAGVADGVVKLIYTRAGGGRGYAPPAPPRGRVFLLLYEAPAMPPGWARDGMRVRFCDTVLARQPHLAGIKHLNRLEQVLARGEWTDPAIGEGLVCDTGGCVISATAANLFIVRGPGLATPALEHCGVKGVMRRIIMEHCAQEGIPLQEGTLTPADVTAAGGALLCNSVRGAWPVCEVDGRPLPVPALVHELVDVARRRLRLA